MSRWIVVVLTVLARPLWLAAAEPPSSTLPRHVENGRVKFIPAPGVVPPQHRLDEHEFDFTLKRRRDLPLSGFQVYDLTYPSPVESPFPENNTVYAEYFCPRGPGPFPAVILLDILDGSAVIPQSQAKLLAQNGIAGLHVRMAYYGPRKPAGRRVRLLSTDLSQTRAAVQQTVLDLRRAVAWLESRPEIDGQKLGICGTSLGSFLAALTAESEPKLSKVALLFGGGGFVDGYSEHPLAQPFLATLQWFGISRETLKQLLAPVDPLTHAANLKSRDVLIIAAKRDDVVPPRMAEMMWEACGQPKIVWFDSTHVGAAYYSVSMLRHVLEHFRWK
jgi:dienelactone hydrolase